MNLQSIYNIFANHQEGTWRMQPGNARRLYEFVKTHDIKRVLDLGTGIGCSTAIIALALSEKGVDYHIDTVEQYDKCIKLANDLIPAEFKDHITFHTSEVKVWQMEGVPFENFSVYETLPEGDWDLILNDGPAPFIHEGAYVELPNATITKMLIEGRLKADTYIAWDGRVGALRTLERYYGNNFYLVKADKNSDFNVIQRKDNPVLFRDNKLEVMKQTTYFNDYGNT